MADPLGARETRMTRIGDSSRSTTDDDTRRYTRSTTDDDTRRYTRSTTDDDTRRYTRSITDDDTRRYTRSIIYDDTRRHLGFRTLDPIDHLRNFDSLEQRVGSIDVERHHLYPRQDLVLARTRRELRPTTVGPRLADQTLRTFEAQGTYYQFQGIIQPIGSGAERSHVHSIDRPGKYGQAVSRAGPATPAADAPASEQTSSETKPGGDERQELLYASDWWFHFFGRLPANTVTYPQLLRECARRRDPERVRILLDYDFDFVARDGLEWLQDVCALGYNRAQIAELLVDAETDTPWMFFEFSDNIEGDIAISFHQDDCIHTAAASLSTSPRTKDDGAAFLSGGHMLDFQSHHDLKNDIGRLCGLAGIVPSSRNERDWTGMVNFTREDDEIIAAVSYDLLDVTLNNNMKRTERILQACRRLDCAISLLQKRGICCETFTVLRWRAAQVELVRIRVASVLQLSDAIKAVHSDPSSIETLAQTAGQIIHLITGIESTDWMGTSAAVSRTLSFALHLAALATQTMCLGFLSYSRGHAGKLRLNYLEHMVDRFMLQGIRIDEQNDVQVLAALVHLTCIGDMLERPVLVFGTAKECADLSSANRFDLLASVEDIIDVWGPGLLETAPALLQENQLSRIRIGGGILMQSSAAPDTLHWTRSSQHQSDEVAHAHDDGISLRIKYVVGSLKDNPNCLLKHHVLREEFLEASASHLSILNTRAPAWRPSTRSLQASGGLYISVTGGIQFTRVDGITAKEALMMGLGDSVCGFSSTWLNAFYGLQVSLCTRAAQRVPLRVLLADVLPEYVASHCLNSTHWDDYQEKLVRALRTGKLEALSAESSITPYRVEILGLFHDVLSNLRNTGVDSKGLFRIAVPLRDQQCFKLECVETTLWAKMLEDTEEDCATFAYITNQCLQHDRIGCKSHKVKAWQGQSELLVTEVYVKPDMSVGHSISGALRPGAEYLIGGLTSGLVAFVNYDEARAQTTLLISDDKMKRIPEKIRKRLRSQSKQRLRERGAISSQATEVAVRAKGVTSTTSIAVDLAATTMESERTPVPYRVATQTQSSRQAARVRTPGLSYI